MHLEPLIFIVRKGHEFKNYGDPYDTVCTLIKIDDKTAMVKGLVGNITKKDLTPPKKKSLSFRWGMNFSPLEATMADDFLRRDASS